MKQNSQLLVSIHKLGMYHDSNTEFLFREFSFAGLDPLPSGNFTLLVIFLNCTVTVSDVQCAQMSYPKLISCGNTYHSNTGTMACGSGKCPRQIHVYIISSQRRTTVMI